jgi:hypothetical protein
MALSARVAMVVSSALAVLGKPGLNATTVKLDGVATSGDVTVEKLPTDLVCDESRPPLSAGLAAAAFSMGDTMSYSGGASAIAFLLSAGLVSYMVWRRYQSIAAAKKLAKAPAGQLQLQPSSPRRKSTSKKRDTMPVHFVNPLLAGR